jgi:Fur family transcriptional regulator, ferric uptake regulator
MQPSLPKNYRLIYDLVQESGRGRHLTPAEIHAQALARRPGIGLTTVYRGLERLRDLGLIAEVSIPGAAATTYEPAGPRHAHFHCSACDTVRDVAFALPARTIATLASQQSFTIDSESITFEGRCARCIT